VLSSACIIPVVGNADALEGTLLSVLERRPDDCEVIVVLNTSYDDPFDLQNELRFIQTPPETGLIGCINLGIAATTAPIIHVLASGLEAGDGWLERAQSHFADARIAAVTPLVYDIAKHDCLLAAGVGYGRGGRRVVCRSIPDTAAGVSPESIGPLSVAASFRKVALAAFGGEIPLAVGDQLADVDLALMLREAGWAITLDPTCRVFASAIDGFPLGGFKFGMWSERLFWHHAKHRGFFRELLAHPLVTAIDCLRAAPLWRAPAQALGRLIGLCQFGHYAKHRLLVEAAKNHAHTATQASVPVPREPLAAVIAEEKTKKQLRVDGAHRGTRHSASAAAKTGSAAPRPSNT
jgi:GT2 family glycosyltransferase